MRKSSTVRQWRKIGVVAGSLAVLAVGAAAVWTQALADPGQHQAADLSHGQQSGAAGHE